MRLSRIPLRQAPQTRNASVRNNLGNTLCDKEDFDSAITEFKDLYRQSPEWEGGHIAGPRLHVEAYYPSAIRELQQPLPSIPAGAADTAFWDQLSS